MTTDSAAVVERLLAELESSGVKLGLDRIRDLLAELGDPQERLPHVLVAGTNGKGSTSAWLSSMLVAAGYRTGLYTSPHLESVRERLRLDGRSIRPEELAARLERVVGVSSRRLGSRPTYFEALTAAAFSWFADEAEVAVLEVGLGGRLDATNCGDPVASLISEIGVDHASILGRTEREIAAEKAGVMRPGRPVLTWVSAPGPRRVLEERARDVGARWVDALAEVKFRRRDGGEVDLATPQRVYRLCPRLAGEHQLRNLALAVRAVEVLAAAGWSRSTPASVAAGASRCRWPGRLESIELADGHRVLLDAAHNPQGAAALERFLAREGEPYRLLFGVLDDKDVAAMLPGLAERATRVILTRPDSPRAAAPAGLAPVVEGRDVRVEDDVSRALALALEPPAARVVVCGSIYLVGEVRRLLRPRAPGLVAAADLELAG